jgi:tetratricopeptide (TPR) repeat protein
MSNVAKLKKQAAEFELKKQFDKALAIYVKMLESFDQSVDELDIALFNRVGDLMLRQGNVADAVDYYERGVDHYAETGFFNNAIALCNKILRHSPGRTSVYYKLGKISAQKGFRNDAKVNFLEYADRMQKAGKVNEAFRALTEFADLCPDQDEIRLMLAEQLTKADRKPEAIEQLQILHERYDSEGQTAEAGATIARMRAIDPKVQPRAAADRGRKTTSGELIFIDLDTPSPAARAARTLTPPLPPRPAPPPPSAPPAPPPAAATIRPVTPTPTPPSVRAVTPAPAPEAVPPTPTPESVAAVPPTPIPESVAAVPPEPTPESVFEVPRTPTPETVSAAPPTPVLESVSWVPRELTPESVRPITPPPASAIVPPAAPTPGVRRSQARVTDPEYDEDAPAIVLDDPLGEIAGSGGTRTVDDALPIEKSTPSSSMFGLQPTGLNDFRSTPTPTSPLIGLESTNLDDGTPAASAMAPTPVELLTTSRASISGDVPAIDDPTIEAPPVSNATAGEAGVDAMPSDSEEETADSSASIDLDLTELVTPTGPAQPPPRASRPTPNTARAALEGLPLMDLEVPKAARGPTMMPSGGELDLVEASLGEEPLIEPMPPDLEDTALRSLTPSAAIYLDDTLTIDGERIAMPTPSSTRKSTMFAAQSVAILRSSVESDPDNWSLHRELAEAMLEAGDRQGGIAELEMAMVGAERSRDLELASSLAEEIARLEPDSVKHHQKRVEFAFLTNDRSRLIEAYVALADTLLRGDQPDKARVVYQRVLDLAPDDIRARAGLESIPAAEATPAPSQRASVSSQRRQSVASPPPADRRPALETPSSSFVNLGDWLRDSEVPKDTRMVVDEQEPTGDEDADFADMLRRFKQGVAENVDAEDYQSHYDLAIAFKEMGLIDEAIAEFQKALGSPTNRLPTYEALGQCFLDKSQFKLASSILSRALSEKASEEKLVGVLYLLGRATEAQGNLTDALGYYQRVFVLDIQFRDVADRLSSLERAPR